MTNQLNLMSKMHTFKIILSFNFKSPVLYPW